MLSPLARVLIPAALSFVIGILFAPLLTRHLYARKAWKKKAGKRSFDGSTADEFNRLHNGNETRAPRMGGIVVWGSTLVTTLGIAFVALLVPAPSLVALNYLTRQETWLPLAAMMVGALVGLLDDILVIRPSGEGLRLRWRLIAVLVLSTFIGWWFYDKLAVVAINVPFGAPLQLGWGIIPLFVLVSLGLYASGVIDGIDGLSGGVFASIFASYTIIAFTQQQFELAALTASILGGLLAFLWFNIPPARFYMSDTGTFALTLTIGVVAFMTDSLGGGIGVAALPIIGALLVATVVSDILQVFWKAVFGKKLFRIAPLHHHFEALGWPGHKVAMRYWVLSIIFAFAGVIVALSYHL